jgi:RNA polymerase sigma-70 factor (ECF subfamily)
MRHSSRKTLSFGLKPVSAKLSVFGGHAGGENSCTYLSQLPIAGVLMSENHTTAAVQNYLDELGGIEIDGPAEPVVRALLARAVKRLELLCATMLYRSYPRLARPPLNLQAEELLSAVVERLIKAMREARPKTVRQFFGMANQHIRWELNDLARRLDEQGRAAPLPDDQPSPDSSDSGLSPMASRILSAIDELPEDEHEVFSLVRIQGMSHAEVANLLGVSAKTIQRRLRRGLMLLAEELADLQ